MARKTIPERVIVTCDRCGGEFDPSKMTVYATSGITLNRNDQDYSGAFVGGTSRKIDLCGDCSERFAEFLKEGYANDQ